MFFFFDSRMRLDTYNICLDSSNALLGVTELFGLFVLKRKFY